MKKVVITLVFLLMISTVMAFDFPVKINTLPNHNVEVYILQPVDTWSKIDSSIEKSGSSGIVEKTFSIPNSEVHVYVLIKKDNAKVHSEWFKNTATTSSFTKYILVEEPAPEPELINETETLNETLEVNETVEEIAEEENQGLLLTGKAILTNEDGSIRSIYYYIGGGILLLILLLIIIKLFRRKSGKQRMSEDDRELSDAEKKIKEAREEIRDVKNRRTRLSNAEKELENDRRELEGLK
jgi:hypothetical protein